LYKREEFYYINPSDLEEKYIPYYEELFKINTDKHQIDTYDWVMALIAEGKVNHIYEYINMFFMFKEQYDIIEHRYLMRDRFGNIIETPVQMCDRVATFISLAEPQDKIRGLEKMSKWYPLFFKKLLIMEISPNTPSWVSAGIPGFGCFACVVVGNDDSLEGLSKWYHDVMYLNKANFGIGHSLHAIRPRESPFGKSKIKTKSAIEWLHPIQNLAVNMSQGSSGRGGANMVTIPVWHPDVIEFINYKSYIYNKDEKINARKIMKLIMNSNLSPKSKRDLINTIDNSIPLKNFNMSVLINNKFMKAVENNEYWNISFSLPDHNWKIEKTYKASDIFEMICQNAWESGDPGILFYDRINMDNVIKKIKNAIYATNPCGEIPVHPFGVCNLWTINLVKHIDFYHRKLSLNKLRDTINITVRAADNLTTVNQYPKEVPEIEKSAKEERRTGIDYTGVADFLYLCKIKYGSKQGEDEVDTLYKFLRDTARQYSCKLGKMKGNFPLYRKSDYKPEKDLNEYKKCPRCSSEIERFDEFIQCSKCSWAKFNYIRNMHLLTQAPTGTRSRKLGVSFGIEPHYYKWWTSNIMEGKVVYNINRILEWYLKKDAESLEIDFIEYCKKIDTKELSTSILENWIEAHELSSEKHLEIQAIAQKWIDQAVSKTINLPKEATIDDIKKIYMMAWKKGCKGITIYREGSHYMEAIGKNEECPNCKSKNLLKVEGCSQCIECGWSKCSI